MKSVVYKAIITIAAILSIILVNQPVTATDVGGIIDTVNRPGFDGGSIV